MKALGYLLITVGFLCGALVSVLDGETVRWGWFIISIAVGAAGVIFIKRREKQLSRSSEVLQTNMESVENSLSRIVENMSLLSSQKESINTYQVRHRIDELFRDDLTVFVEARQSIAHAYGLTNYGDIMSSFAAGERYLNRVWSASADGYIDEVNAYLDKAQQQFTDSLEKIQKLHTSKS